jgi:DNA-binding response OmpR family regulator
MIAIVSSLSRERTAFASLCEAYSWTSAETDSLRGFNRMLGRWQPKVVLVRQKLSDGYSDNVFAALSKAGLLPATKVVVLVAAGTPSALEARQVALGGDCVLRDPVSTDVLLQYLAKYMNAPKEHCSNGANYIARVIPFATATLSIVDRTLTRGSKTVPLTPREVELIELLAGSSGAVIMYEMLYSEILHRKFQGDTSNMRVLLGKLGRSADRIGVRLRDWIEVIPKLGYRYNAANAESSRTANSSE